MAKAKNGNGEIDTVEEETGAQKTKEIAIPPPNFQTATIWIEGTTWLVQNAFSRKVRDQIKGTQEEGGQKKTGKKTPKPPKDFDALYHDAMHVSTDGWIGIPASAFRNAMISACKLVGFKMTQGKISIFVEADGVSASNGRDLVKILEGEPAPFDDGVRLPSFQVDIRVRPRWLPGWKAKVRVRFDADIFSAQDIVNLLSRAGSQIGIGEGRFDSKKSCGVGWGCFKLLDQMEVSG